MHIFRSKDQPATRYRCDAGFMVRFKPRKLLYCFMCNRRRWAKNLTAQSYYDGDRFFCKPGKGCKSDAEA